MRLSIYECELLIDALTARSARYTSMALDDDISMKSLARYERNAEAMRSLRDKLRAMKAQNVPMTVELMT